MCDYNEESVHYCSQCLYLGNPRIEYMQDTKIEYCPYCGSTKFNDDDIYEWENKFEKKYKQGKFIKIKKSWREIMEASQQAKIIL